jgi:ATP-dependent DNA helicase DinG
MSQDKNSRQGSQELNLDSLFLPTTPSATREMYKQLEAMAQTQDFGLLEDDIVVLDTETTGLSFKNCELIEIAAARMSGREITARFHTFVHPHAPIPKQIQALTHIHEIDVADAPSAEKAVANLAAFVGGVPVLAHNATFDRTFIEKVHGGSEVSETWIDTLALSRIALPCLKSHRLSDMATAFHCDSVTHRATDDVDALCGMWRIMLCGLSQLPTGLMRHLADMHPEVNWSYRPIFAHLALEYAGAQFSLVDTRKKMAEDVREVRKDDAQEAERAPQAPTKEEINAAFSPEGVVAHMYSGYEARPEQLEMAQEVRSAFATSTHRAIEAGTGVGKSMAYLLPAIMFAKRNNFTVGVATKTNTLTDQLVTHELPGLDACYPGGVRYYALKGYTHYPCLMKLERAAVTELPLTQIDAPYRTENAIASDMLTALATVYAYSCQLLEGDLDTLGIRWRSVPRSMLTINSSDCVRNHCPFYPHECFIHGARKRAASADVVVTNHSLLLRNVAADNAILPPIRHWIVDEAHDFESEARRQWAEEFSGDLVRETFETIGSTKTGVLHQLMVSASTHEASTLMLGLLTKAASAASRAAVSTATLQEAIHELHKLAKPSGGYDNLTLWIDDTVRSTKEWQGVYEAAEEAARHLNETEKALTEAQTALESAKPQQASALQEPRNALTALMQAINDIVLAPQEGMVCSAELYRQTRRMSSERLVAQKLNIGQDLAENWLPEMASIVYTSATMTVGNDFKHFTHAVGLDLLNKSDYKTIQLNSSYDFDRNMGVIVAKNVPAPQDANYLPALTQLLFDIHTAMDGSVLTLFTNRRDMEKVYADLKPLLADAGLDLECQDKGSSSQYLSRRFIEDKKLSLLALKSFWEGFDATGDTLRCVVIPKLPFASPQDPLVCERDFREERAWWKYSLPEAVLAVKQAAGRLIRTSTDTGILVLADSRLVTKRYGSTFIKSLPSTQVQQVEQERVGEYIRLWRQSHKA